jgi:hypothetical protein
MSAMTLDRLAELMEARFQAAEAGLQSMRAEVNGNFQQVNSRFQQVDARFERLEARTEAVENGLIDLRMDMLAGFRRLDTRIDRLGDEMRQRFREIG